MPKRSKRREKSVDAQQLLSAIQNLNPAPPITLDDLMRNHQRALRNHYRTDANLLIQDFMSCFGFRSGKATLIMSPDNSVLEIIAEGFKRYWNRTGSLDDAFDLKKVKGRGNAREQERLRVEQFKAQIAYEELRKQGLLKKQAIREIAAFLKCSEHKAHSLIFRQRKPRK